jgi:hypothetical protein
VAEERYVQTGNPRNRGLGTRVRVLVSDFLLVKRQDGKDWLQFRDVREVDGRAVGERDQRLTELFLQPWDTALEQAQRIASDGARYNLVDIGTINYPLIAMAFFQPIYRARFEFSIGGLEREARLGLRVIAFRETNAKATIVAGARSSGRAWVDDATGRVMKTELQLQHSLQRFVSTITTSFVVDERLQLAVPAEMRDSYSGYLDMTGVATYGRFRSFQVRTEETVRP